LSFLSFHPHFFHILRKSPYLTGEWKKKTIILKLTSNYHSIASNP
jgi:hypothetical protein